MDKRYVMVLLLGALVMVGLLTYVLFRTEQTKPVPVTQTAVTEQAGEAQNGWTPFYHAKAGTWKILDEAAYVLKEQKFTSSDAERDAYSVYKLESGGVVRMMEARGRWKMVDVLVDGKVVASGWIDAHFIKAVEQVREDTPGDGPGTDDGSMTAPEHEETSHDHDHGPDGDHEHE